LENASLKENIKINPGKQVINEEIEINELKDVQDIFNFRII
jgi:hypothetical protein